MAQDSERFLSRWSRRKHEIARATAAAPAAPAVEDVPPVAAEAPLPPDVAPAPPAPAAEVAAVPLPPVETLSFDSDFRPFLKPEVEASVQRAALKKLFSDPHFNVMDGLDIYIDDYNKPDPMPAGMLEKIVGVYERLTEESAAKEAAEAAAVETAANEAAAPGVPPETSDIAPMATLPTPAPDGAVPEPAATAPLTPQAPDA
jgi:hypothetical protein